MSRTDRERITDALNHIEAMHRHLSRQNLSDGTVADAVSMRLSAAIESLRTADGGLESRLCGDDWKSMWAMRNRLAHGYISADLGIVRTTVSEDLPEFERNLRRKLDDLHDPWELDKLD